MFYKGLVINNKDLNKNRRVQIRVLGIHPMDGDDDYNLVIDECLPWARPCVPIGVNSSGAYGKFDIPDEEQWVWCFFEDVEFQRPIYFGIIVADDDVDYQKNDTENVKDYEPTKNSIDTDRFGNIIYRDDKSFKIILADGSIVLLDEYGIIVKTKDGNIISLDDKNKKIMVRDVSNNLIEMTEDSIVTKNKKGTGVKIKNDMIELMAGDIELSVNGIKLVQWLAEHTHTTTYPTQPTSPPTLDQIPSLNDLMHKEVKFTNGKPYVIDPADEDFIVERLGEETPLAEPYANAKMFNYEKNKFEEMKALYPTLSDDEIQEKIEEDYLKYVSIYEKTDSEFDSTYPIRNDYVGIPPEFILKLEHLDGRLQTILKESYLRYDFRVTSGYRSPEYQNELFKKHMTTCDGYKKISKHNRKPTPCADIVPSVGGSRNKAGVAKLHDVMFEMARRQGSRLKWLGKVIMPSGFRDVPHYELI